MPTLPERLPAGAGADFLLLIDRIDDAEVRAAFIWALMAIPKETSLWIAPYMRDWIQSAAIFRGDSCSFALSPAKRWVLAYLRKPEMRHGLVTPEAFKLEFPGTEQNGSGEYTIRLESPSMFERFVDLLR